MGRPRGRRAAGRTVGSAGVDDPELLFDRHGVTPSDLPVAVDPLDAPRPWDGDDGYDDDGAPPELDFG